LLRQLVPALARGGALASRTGEAGPAMRKYVGTGLVARWQPDFSPGCPRATHRVLIIIVAGTLSKEHLGML
jgi:hypothetical protein